MRAFLAPYTFGLLIALCAAVIGMSGYIYVQGLWLEDAEQALEAARAYIQATDEVRDAQDTVPSDPDQLIQWLRDFSE